MAENASAQTLKERMGVEVRNIGIPPRPAILGEIDKELYREEPDFHRLAEIVSADVGLAASIIKVANSPFFGMGRRVRSVADALLVLGLKVTIHTIAGIVLERTFPNVPSLERFWDSAARAARLSRWLAQHLKKSHPDDAYTFGLFRDCGIPVLMIPFPEYAGILKQANAEDQRCFTDIEDAGLAINHAIVGAELAEDWLLPNEIVLAIRHHHDPAALAGTMSEVSVDTRRLIAIAQLAEHIVQSVTGLSQTREWDKLGDFCLAALDLDEADVEQLIDDSREVVGATL